MHSPHSCHQVGEWVGGAGRPQTTFSPACTCETEEGGGNRGSIRVINKRIVVILIRLSCSSTQPRANWERKETSQYEGCQHSGSALHGAELCAREQMVVAGREGVRAQRQQAQRERCRSCGLGWVKLAGCSSRWCTLMSMYVCEEEKQQA
eukprot:superscaffoldBa00003333_g16681